MLIYLSINLIFFSAKHIFEVKSVLAFVEKESFLARDYQRTRRKKENSKMIHFLCSSFFNSPLSLPVKKTININSS